MVGLINSETLTPSSFSDRKNDHTFNGDGKSNGHRRLNGSGFTNSSNGQSPNAQSINGDFDLSDGYDRARENGIVEPIAIIGMSCRLPGGSSSASKLWDLLSAGVSAQGPFPNSRFNIDGFYHPNGARPGSLNTAGGYFINEDIRAFENSFFGINSLEATFMDPQQRKLLEVVFECFENAGLSLDQLSGANVGCYVGNFVTDFITMQLKDAEYTHRYTATGLGTTILANRISHVFNLKGPSFVIDTACSSSLYCLHAACSALQSRDCDSAVVAGANLIQSPEQQLATMKAGVLSKTSTCHTFDSSADGYGRGDGIGALLVKRLADAIRDGDPIRAVIRGTAVNSNGRTNGITLPSADGQEAVIRKAYAQAGLSYDETDYVECHGTGTAVGDPIEVEATSRVFKRPQSSSPLLIGSVKTNLGHSEAASGISSIIKVVLALEKGVIPPTIGVNAINPKIKLDEWNIKIVTEKTPWPSSSSHHVNGRVRRAGVNSFGYGGANSHVIIDAADMHLPSEHMSRPSNEETTALARTKIVLPFSANNDTALERRVTDLSSVDLRNINTIDLAYTLGVKRSHLPVRGYVVTRPGHLAEDLTLENLCSRTEGRTYPKLPLAFVFTGQGAQWPEMGRELLAEFPIFRRTIQMMDSTLQLLPHPPSWTLLGTLLESADTSMINHASRSQPICTAVQVGLVKLISTFGVKPQSVLGHSSGEIAAAYASGYVTAEQAITIAYYRGYTVTRSSNAVVGAMMAAGIGYTDANENIRSLGLGEKINVACVNSPESVTISGDVDGIQALKAHLDSQGIFARILKTDDKAYHSRHMAALGQEYEDHLIAAVSAVDAEATNSSTNSSPADDAKWISSVNGEVVEDGIISPAYWRANLESPVLFENAVGKLLQDFGSHHLVEIGPHSALELPIKQTCTKLSISKDKVHYGTALSRGKNSVTTLLKLVGDLYLHGHDISFKDVNVVSSWPPKLKANVASEPSQGAMVLDLPNYHWDYDPQQKLFHESRISVEWRNRKYPRHDLLGSQVHGGNGIITSWRNVLKAKDVPWIEGHKLDTTTVVPAAGYLAMAIEAISQVKDVTEATALGISFRLQDIHITKALVLPEEDALDTGVELFTTLQPVQLPGHGASEWHQFNISSYVLGAATTHATGLIKLAVTAELDVPGKLLPDIKHEDVEPTAPRTWYSKFAESGLNYQDAFQALTQVHVHTKRQEMKILASTDIHQGRESVTDPESKYIIHPVTIDALFQAGIIANTRGIVRELRGKVPVHIEQMVVRPPSRNQSAAPTQKSFNVKAISEPVGFGTIRVSGELLDECGLPILQINRCRLVAYQSGIQQQDQEERHPMLRVVWKPDITKLSPSNTLELSSYIEQYVARATIAESAGECEIAMTRLRAVLDLLAHKNPKMRILTVLSDERYDSYVAETLRMSTSFKRCQSLWCASLAADGTLQFRDHSTNQKPSQSSHSENLVFDAVLFGPRESAGWDSSLTSLKDFIAPNGTLVCVGSSKEASKLERLGFEKPLQSQLGDYNETIITRPCIREISEQNGIDSATGEVLIVERDPHHSLNAALDAQIYSATGRPARRVALNQVTADLVQAYASVIATIEIEEALLSCVTEDEMRLVKILTDNCADLIWVTGGALLQGVRPELGVVFGLSRALMLEQPSLRFFVVDIDVDASSPSSEIDTTASHILDVLKQTKDSEPDFEFIHAMGVLHVSRFVPAETLNSTFREKLGAEKRELTLGEARPFRLDSETVGQLDSIFFRREEAGVETPLTEDCVEVEVEAISLTIRDLQSISGNAENSSDTTCTSQYGGVVRRAGASVKRLVPGDRVIVMAPGYFATRERVSESACYKLNDGEDLKTMTNLPLPLCTAIYAIRDRARLEANESILIHCDKNTSDVSAELATIRVAQQVGAEVFVACTSTEAQEQLLRDLKMPQDHVFTANDTALAAKLRKSSGYRGFDVIVSFAGNVLPGTTSGPMSIGSICADCARLVQVGSRGSGLAEAVIADPTVLHRNITLTTFDMGDLIARQTPANQSLRRRLLYDSMTLYRNGHFSGIDLSPGVWDVSEVGEAFRALTSKQGEEHPLRSGVVVSLQNDKSSIPVMPIKYDTKLSSEKTYLLIGCLGGLGRSMSKWMLSRGARKFVFMGRSGTDKTPARRLVENLQSLGAEVTVVRGDVVNSDDVNRAVAGIVGPVGGVIQAAMGLDEALFTTMPRDYWLAGLRPKVTGSWNLYNALAGCEKDLDFFLMTSSVSGSVGTATESNYCSANYFLDVFARYCRNLGIPAVSVGLGMISEVGYLHENPEIEALLLRKGIQAINEDEMLHIIDIALSTITSSSTGTDDTYDRFALGHVLTGLEPLGLKALRAKGFEGTSPVLGDPRAFLLSAALDETTSGTGTSSSTNGLAAEVAEAIEAGSSVEEAVLKTVSQKFSGLVLIPKDKLDVTKPISSVGVDSMLAAEFRAWIFQAFKVDVPYLTLLSPAATLTMLAEMITQNITET